MKANGLQKHRLVKWVPWFFCFTLLAFAGLIYKSGVTWPADRILYDMQSTLMHRALDPRIVLIRIDKKSLDAIGRWPWPRDVHASLLDNLHESELTLLDIVFSEPSDSQRDQALQSAISRHGKVLLPVLIESLSDNSQLIETLPLPGFAMAALGLGHVQVEVDPDGVGRSLYLYEGIGSPHWPALPLLASRLMTGRPDLPASVNGRVHADEATPVLANHRDHYAMIPFAGPPGTLPYYSYIDVLSGTVAPEVFAGKIVLVGATASGLGDFLPVPTSASHYAMAGVEIMANSLNGLLTDQMIAVSDEHAVLFLSLFLCLLCSMLFPRLSPALNLVIWLGMMVVLFVISAVVFRWQYIWFPISLPLAVLFIAYPLWTWWRLNAAHQFLKVEINELESRLQETQSQFGNFRPEEVEDNGVVQDLLDYGRLHDLPSDMVALLTQPSNQHLQQADAAFALQQSVRDVLHKQIYTLQAAQDRFAGFQHLVFSSYYHLSSGVVLFNIHGDVIFSNSAAHEMLGDDGLNNESVLALLTLLGVDSDSEKMRLLHAVLLQKQPFSCESHTQTGLSVVVKAAPLDAMETEIHGGILTISDITPLRERERQRNEAINYLSHDLRSPMVSLITLLDMAKSNSDNITPKLIDDLKVHAERSLHLSEQFLQLARAENENDDNWTVNDISSIALNAADRLFPIASAKSIGINMDCIDDCVWVSCNPELLERALINLMDNAVKYSDAETTVTCSVGVSGQCASIVIQDQGCGIAGDDLRRVFEAFQRVGTPASVSQRGAGLGLKFVRTVIEKHGGEVRVESELGKGTAFTVELPLAEEELID